MSNLQTLKRRLKNTANVEKMAKTMEMVAAVKMRHAQEIALAARPYALAALELFSRLSSLKETLPPILQQRSAAKTLFVLIASDKGLAGMFNSALLREFEKYIGRNPIAPEDACIAVGGKAAKYLERKKYHVLKQFPGTADYATTAQTRPLSDYLMQGYLAGEWSRVIVFSIHFRSALRYEPVARQLLPVEFEKMREVIQAIIPETGKFSHLRDKAEFFTGAKTANYLIEPSAAVVLEKMAERLLHAQVYSMILESNAAEHSARRLAMKTAADNAAELKKEITLEYNKARQAAVTKEIIEISAGAEALS